MLVIKGKTLYIHYKTLPLDNIDNLDFSTKLKEIEQYNNELEETAFELAKKHKYNIVYKFVQIAQ